jgi:bacteriorhodopsin
VAYTLLVPVRSQASLLGSDVSRAYTISAIYLIFFWIIYPIAFGVSEGGNVIAPDSEVVFYGVLDILSKLGLTFLILWGFRDIEPQRLGLANGEGTHAAPAHANKETAA